MTQHINSHFSLESAAAKSWIENQISLLPLIQEIFCFILNSRFGRVVMDFGKINWAELLISINKMALILQNFQNRPWSLKNWLFKKPRIKNLDPKFFIANCIVFGSQIQSLTTWPYLLNTIRDIKGFFVPCLINPKRLLIWCLAQFLEPSQQKLGNI